jgi:heme-degrading monooxygenase HmoA
VVVTVLSARVDVNRVQDLERAYQAALVELPSGILETFLVRDTRSTGSYQIITVWKSRADLDAMRSSGVTPKGVQIFQSVGAGPDVSVLDVIAHAHD